MASDREQHRSNDLAAPGDASIARIRALLDRPLPPQEIEENTALVSTAVESRSVRMRSVLVFMIGPERLALEADDTHRVVPHCVIRRVPHRTNETFLGLANVAGELAPVAALGAALGISGAGSPSHFVLIGSARARWAFGVDRLGGVRRVDERRVVAAPTTVRHAVDGCTKYLTPIVSDGHEDLVAVLDADKLVARLGRSLA